MGLGSFITGAIIVAAILFGVLNAHVDTGTALQQGHTVLSNIAATAKIWMH